MLEPSLAMKLELNCIEDGSLLTEFFLLEEPPFLSFLIKAKGFTMTQKPPVQRLKRIHHSK